jgi:hypothetical protein
MRLLHLQERSSRQKIKGLECLGVQLAPFETTKVSNGLSRRTGPPPRPEREGARLALNSETGPRQNIVTDAASSLNRRWKATALAG